MKSIYIIGALKNWGVVSLAEELQSLGFEAFADWITPGPEADAYLLKYAKLRGWSYKQALNSYAATHVFEFDKTHLDRSDIVVMLMPAGKSAHMEFGHARGQGKPGYILFDKEPERFDVMYKFATDIFFDKIKLFEALKGLL
jgi:nucleoside 2-deoxyribosyltransferase